VVVPIMGNESCMPVSDDARETHDDKVSGLLVNVFGLKLPNEMFSQAARNTDELARILQEYAAAVEQTKR
jgi:hypothetical protein